MHVHARKLLACIRMVDVYALRAGVFDQVLNRLVSNPPQHRLNRANAL